MIPPGAKLAGAFLILGILIWLLGASHIPELFLETRLFFRVLGFILVPAGIVWMFYLALEPYVRRIWPETVISWSRLLTGRLNDPLVASHVLIGLATAVLATILAELGNILPMHFGHAAAVPSISLLVRFMAKENPGAMSLRALLEVLYMGLLYLLSLVLFQLVVGKRWIASLTFVVLVSASTVAQQWQDAGWIQCIEALLLTGLVLMLLVRFGLVSTLAALWAIYLLRDVPVTSDMTIWYARQTRFAMGFLSVAALAAATAATRGWRPRAPISDPLPPPPDRWPPDAAIIFSHGALRRGDRSGNHQHALHDLRPGRRGGRRPERARADFPPPRLGRARSPGNLEEHAAGHRSGDFKRRRPSR